jgi:hypothetical protein
MLTAATTGVPRSSSWLVRYRCRSRLVASTYRHHHRRSRLLGPAAEQQIDRDHLVRAAGGEAVRPGQVDQLDGGAAGLETPLLHLDRHARVVADPLAQPGQGVEQGRLARVRVADQRDGEGGGRHVESEE